MKTLRRYMIVFRKRQDTAAPIKILYTKEHSKLNAVQTFQSDTRAKGNVIVKVHKLAR